MAKQAAYTERMAGNVVVREVEGDISEIDQTIISRSVYVTGFQNKTAERLIIHFQREKNGGRDIEMVMVSKKGTAVITFYDPKVASSVLQHRQVLIKDEVPVTVKPCLNTLTNKCDQRFEIFQVVSADLDLKFVDFVSHDQTKALLSDIADKTGVQYIEKAENFTISGSFQQVQATRNILKQSFGQFKGARFFCGLKRKEDPSPEGHLDKPVIDSEAEKQEDVNQNERLKAAEDEANYSSEKPADNIDNNASSRSPKIETFEVEAKIFQVITKAHDKKLKSIESKYHVEIPRKTEGGKLILKPKDSCSMDQYQQACDQFTEVYKQAFLMINRESFSVKDEKTNAVQEIIKVRKRFPISLERSEDQSHWEMYGEASHIEKALETLKQEGIEIIRDKENANHDEAMDLGQAKNARDIKPSGKALETHLGKVKVSVYKGDITSEKVDVIVNAANRDLQHIGGVAKAILDKGGELIQKESQAIMKKRRHTILRDGEVVTTASGNLPCKLVVHAVGPIWRDMGPMNSKKLLRQACLSSFEECQAHELKSIALPAIGSGAFGMPKDVCAEVMFETMEEFIGKGDPKKKWITDIRFVNIDDASVQAFSREFMFRYDDNLQNEKFPGAGFDEMLPTDATGQTLKSQSRSNRGRNLKGNASNGSHSAPSHLGSSIFGNDHPLSFSDNAATSSSDALTREMRGKDGRLPPGAGAMKDKEEEDCPICLDTLTNPKTLRCKHVFCSGCIQKALAACNKCPMCQEPQGMLIGNQPPGQMRFHFEPFSVPGYEGNRTIIIDYHFPSGIQGSEHPHPRQYYDGTSRTAYLPDTREGREVLQLLRRAFDARLVFTIGTSITTGRSNQVIWNDIHHKTRVSGGASGFGYPDPDYLRRVKEELAAKGIR